MFRVEHLFARVCESSLNNKSQRDAKCRTGFFDNVGAHACPHAFFDDDDDVFIERLNANMHHSGGIAN